jgi:hypothetical protein
MLLAGLSWEVCMRPILCAIVLVLAGVPGTGAAEVMATGPVLPGVGVQNVGVCYLINVGGSSVTLTSIEIHNVGGSGDAVLLSISNTCGTTLGAGNTCRTVSNIVANVYECKVVVSSKTNIRGEFEARVNLLTVAHQALR